MSQGGEELTGWDRGLHWSQVWGPYLVPQPGYLRSWFSYWGELCDQLGIGSGEMGRVISCWPPWDQPFCTPFLFCVPSPILSAGNTTESDVGKADL